MRQNLIALYKGLINIFQCSFYLFSGKDQYPTAIIPKRNYINPIDIDALHSSNESYVTVRRSAKTEDETFNELHKLKEHAIVANDKKILGLSMNLLGGKFEVEHIKFRTKNAGSESWKTGEPVYFFQKHKNDFEVLEEVLPPIFLYLKDIHEVRFPYRKQYDKETAKICKALSIGIEIDENDSSKIILVGQSKVKHTPTNLNYWHIEFSLVDAEKKEIRRSDSKWQESATLAALQILTAKAKKNIETPACIPKSVYCN